MFNILLQIILNYIDPYTSFTLYCILKFRFLSSANNLWSDEFWKDQWADSRKISNIISAENAIVERRRLYGRTLPTIAFHILLNYIFILNQCPVHVRGQKLNQIQSKSWRHWLTLLSSITAQDVDNMTKFSSLITLSVQWYFLSSVKL